jgi:hypothetical protein
MNERVTLDMFLIIGADETRGLLILPRRDRYTLIFFGVHLNSCSFHSCRDPKVSRSKCETELHQVLIRTFHEVGRTRDHC